MGLSSSQYTNLFEIIGEYVQRINDFVTIISDLETDRSQIETEMQANSAPIALYSDNTTTFDGFKSAVVGWISSLTSKIQDVLNNKELVLDNFNTTSGWEGVLIELINDMNDTSQTIQKSVVTIGSITATKTNSTAGTVLLDATLDGYNAPTRNSEAYEAYNGVASEMAATSDAMNITCVSDSVVSSINENSESFEWGGTVGSEVYSADVSGSGEGPSINPLKLNTGSYLTNADFETWTDASTVGTWTKNSSDAATRSASPYKGTYAMSFVGDGSKTWDYSQPLVANSVNRYRRYCLACYVKAESGIGAGSLEVKFTGTGFTASSTEKFTMDASALSAATSWTLKHFYINIPTVIPSDLAVSITLSGGLTSGKTVLIDELQFGPVVYHGGINAVVIMGAGVFRKNDNFSFTVSNNDAGKFQTFFRKGMGLQLPSSSSPSIADSLSSD
tara:strand:- start:129 stop:1469 length:1341 start_codon:yes stop_codon:yes gene_type:complete